MELQCQSQTADPQNPTITVGEAFLLKCQGDLAGLESNAAELMVAEADKYKLQLLDKRQSSPSTLDLVVTSYMVGDHKDLKVQLTDSKVLLNLSAINVQVRSVQDPQNPAKEAFPPIGPILLPWPMVVWVLIGTIVISFLCGGGYWLYQKQRFTKLFKKMNAPSVTEAGKLFF